MRRALLAVTAVGAATAITVAVTGAASATDPDGATGAPPKTGSGLITDRVDIHSRGVETTRASVGGLALAAGGTSGWHSHPGPTVVIVNTGSVIMRSVQGNRCVERVYEAGFAFVDPGRGFAHEVVGGESGATLTLTSLHPADAGPARIDADAPAACS